MGGDITEGRWRQEWVDLAVRLDVEPRRSRGWHRRRHLDQTLTWPAWRRALASRRPAIQHVDQGVQSAARASLQRLPEVGAQRRMAAVGEATEHGDAERLMRTMTAEEVTLPDEADVHEVYPHLGRFLGHLYPHTRRPSALGDLTPEAFETQWVPQQRLAGSVT